MTDGEIWISAAELKKLVPLAVRYSINQKVRERAGFGLLRIRLKVAHLTSEGRRNRVTDYDVPDRFLEATSTGPSRAHIDVNADKFRAKYPARLIGVTRDQVVEGIGLLFEATSLASAFDLTIDQTNEGAAHVGSLEAILPEGWKGKPIAIRKPFVDMVACLLRTAGAKSLNDAASKVARDHWKAAGSASEDAARKIFSQDFARLYQPNGMPR